MQHDNAHHHWEAVFVGNARDWQLFHSPKHLSMSIAIEVAELMEHLQWLTPKEAREAVAGHAARSVVAEELADVIIYCLSLSNVLSLDTSSAVLDKLAVNEARYPVSEFRSRFRRPERDKGEDKSQIQER